MKIKTFKHNIIEVKQRDTEINAFDEEYNVGAMQTNIEGTIIVSTVFHRGKKVKV